MKKPKLLALSLVVPQLAGLVGSLFTFPAVAGWYRQVARPAITPPDWIFGPVWTLLYLMMGVSLYLVLVADGPKKRALTIFGLQLAFNVLWSGIFFGARLFGLALIEILILWVLILLSIGFFWRIDRRAGWLLVPYLGWVSFASWLNYSFWLINQ